jgi:hypothetical protein
MLAQLARRDLDAAVAELGAKSRDTWLHFDLAGRDPDEGVGAIAYDKGFYLLRTLERAFGRERFDAFLRKYFDTFAFQSMTTARFVEYLEANLLAQDPAAAKRVDVKAWIYGPGVPPSVAPARSEAFARVDRELARLARGAAPATLDTKGWVTQQWLHFLGNLPDSQANAIGFAVLDDAFRFTQSGNSEIFAEWARLSVRHGYRPVFPALENFLLHVGRRKFLTPIYRELQKSPENLAWAKDVYRRARPGYHSAARSTLDPLMAWTDGQKP